MKKIREKKVGTIFKYRHNLVRVVLAYNNNSCDNCVCGQQNLCGVKQNYNYKTGSYVITKCASKHRCLNKLRKDEKNIIFTKIKSLEK